MLPLNVSSYRLAKDTGIPQTRLSQILKVRQRMSADTALRLSQYFGTTPKFWLGLQDDFDIEEAKTASGNDLLNIRLHNNTAA